MKNTNNGLVHCLKVLMTYSDYDHPLSLNDIIDLIEQDFNRSYCRQSISKYITELNKMDILIESRKRKYYYDNRLFEDSEIELLCHSVISNTTIPANYSMDLIDKLKNMQGKYFANNKNLSFNICNLSKRDNQDLFLNIDMISGAIDKSCALSFHYYRYNSEKQFINFSKKTYRVVPIFTIALDNRFYLVALSADGSFEGYRHYRIDKIKDIKIEEKHKLQLPECNPYDYARHRIYMQSGEIEKFELEIKNNQFIFDELIDVCGIDIEISKKDKDTYRAIIYAPEQSIIYLAFQYIQFIKIISPARTKNKIIDILKEKSEEYQKQS